MGNDPGSVLTRMSLGVLLEEVVQPHRNFDVEVKVAMDGPTPEPVCPRSPGVLYGLGNIVENAEKGVDAKISVDSPAGKAAAKVIHDLAHSKASPSDLSVSNEGTAGSTFGGKTGSFLVNWTYIFHNYDESAPDVAKDIGYTRYPQTVAGQDSRPPYGGIGIGVSAYSSHKDMALEAADCIVSPDMQGLNAEKTGNMPASAKGYDYPALKKAYPADLLELFQKSVEAAAPRSVTPYWSDISSAIQSTWHPPGSVDDKTP